MLQLGFVPILFCLFQNLFQIILGPHCSSGRNRIVKYIQCFPHASSGESHVNIIAGYLHIHPCSCGWQQPRDKKCTAGPRQVGNPLVPVIWPEVAVPAPRCGLLFSLPWKIPFFGVLTEASCPSRDWLRPSAWGSSQDLSGPRSRVTNLSQKPPSVLGKRGQLVTLLGSSLDFSF